MVVGVIGEQGNKDADFLKDEKGKETPPEGQDPNPTPKQEDPLPQDPAKPSEEDQEKEFKAELVKRFGEKSDQELVKEVWKAYRNGETTFGQAQEKVKELESLVNQFGGVDVLKKALEAPAAPASAGNRYPAKVQALIDSGHLDPNDPRDALVIDQEIRLEQSQQITGQQIHERAVDTFETWLKAVSTKYEYADIDVIREMGFKGAFANLTDEQTQAAIENIANRQHSKVLELADKKTQAKLDELKNLNKNKLIDGKPGGGKATDISPKQAFDRAYDENIKGDE